MRPQRTDLYARQQERYNSLSEPMRVVLRLRFRDGLRPSHIAREMALTVDETKDLLAAAIAAFGGA